MMSVVEFFSQPVWHRLGLTLVHFLWQGLGVAAIAYAAVRVLAVKRGNPRYTAYLLAFTVLAASPLITFTVLGVPTRPAAIAMEPSPQIESSRPIPRSVSPEPLQQRGENTPYAGPTRSVPLGERLEDAFLASLPWALACWMGGVLILSVRLLLGSVGLCRWRRNLEPLPDELKSRAALLSERLGLSRFCRIFMSRHAREPAALGYLRPLVLLPTAMVTGMPTEMLEAIIAHELAHIRRHDLWVNLAQRVVETLLFYHPAVWWLSNRLRAERELCCDGLAVRATGERLTYASALESAGRARLAIRQPALAVALGRDGKSTLGRVRHVLGLPSAPADSRPWLAGAVAVAILAVLTVPATWVLAARAEPSTSTDGASSRVASLHEAAAAGSLEQVNKLLAQRADLNQKDKDGWTSLHHAAWNGRRDVAAVLIAEGANVNATNATNRTPLHLAAAFGDRFVPELLLANGANINARDEAGDTPVHVAAGWWCVNEDLLELLIEKGADVNARNETGLTPLHLAVTPAGRRKSERVVEFLLAHGADINARDKDGRTPLHVAAGNGARKETVEFLLNKGADIKARNAAGATALHLAAANTHSDIAELLVNRGADVNSVDSRGQTPLHYAVERGGDNETVERLIAKGADVNAKADHGETPAHLAAIRRNPRDKTVTLTLLLSKGADISSIQLAAYLGDLARVKGFLANGVGVNTQDVYSVTPLHAAALGGQREVAEFLLSKGALVNADSAIPSLTTPLHCAALAGSREVAELLIEKGAEIDAKDKNGMTPLHAATAGRDADTARLLIARGADVNAKSQGGWTPLHLAAYYGAKDLVLLLLDHDANINAQTANGTMPSEFAARGGHEDVVRLLIDKGAALSNRDVLLSCACRNQQRDLAELLIRKGADVNSKARGGNNAPTLEAIWYGYGDHRVTETPDIPKLIGILKLLMDNGADPDAKDRWDWSLLHYACGNVDLTRLLLDRGANPNVRTEGWDLTPLYLVAREGNKAVTQLLLSRGADVNAKDFDGHTPLSYAEDVGDNDIFGRPRETPLTAQVKAAKKEVAEVLREHGAKE